MSIDSQATINKKIKIEQIRILHDSIPVLLFINIMVAFSLGYGFSDVVVMQNISICLGLLSLMVVVRSYFFIKLKNNFNPENLRPQQLSLILGSASAGIIWGLMGVLFFPIGSPNYQLFLIFSLMGMTGGSAFTYSIYMPGYFCYVPIILLPITIYLFILGSKFQLTLGVVSLVFILVLTLFNLKLNKNFKATLALRFENLELIEELKLQKEEAERANRAKSKFLAAASHDLRQPLYALGLFTSVLDETIQYPKVKVVVEKIHASVFALTQLFDKLLDISQLDAGGITVTKQKFFLKTLFDKLALEFNRDGKDVKVIWPTECPAVYSEPNLLGQILRNYLSNAIKYTHQGQVSVICAIKNQIVTIQVIDTGIGINEEDIDDIFEEFYQLNNPERDREKGLGLGLSIVKRTAELLEHEIAVSSVVGQGTTFSISIEIAHKVVLPSSVDLSNEKHIEPDNKIVVVVDDEEDIRQGLESILSLWGYRVITAQDSEGVLQQLEKINGEPSVIISDYRLRGEVTGVEVIRAIHNAFKKEVPALLITGDIEVERLVEMKKGGFQILFKPVPAMKLRTFIRSCS